MANIPSNAAYLNDLEISDDAPITTDLWAKSAGSINYLLDRAALGVTQITSSQNYTTQEGMFRLHFVGCGAGPGGGGGARTPGGANVSGGGGGGGGAPIFEGILDVLENTIYSVTIPAGGAGGAGAVANGSGFDGSPGADTSFGSILNIQGGLAGFAGTVPAGGAASPTRAGTHNGGAGSGTTGGDKYTLSQSFGAQGAAGGSGLLRNGGGGGGSIGNGGVGATTDGGAGIAGSSYGGGGGGGGGGNTASPGGAGGNGFQGVLFIYAI